MPGKQRRSAELDWRLPLLLVTAGIVVFANSISGMFVFDDVAIVERAQLGQLWPIHDLMNAAADTPVAGRPVAAFSLALNYALGGLDVGGYHVFNIAVHILAALALFGIVRRTLAMTTVGSRSAIAPDRIAFACALLWMLHPLQTEAVDYISQRTESLMGLFYLLTLYAAIRALEPAARGWWSAASVFACALGMATKEVMVTAPLLVVLYDATFVKESFRQRLGRRWPLYTGLAATWAILALLASAAPRVRTAGFATDVTVLEYAANQCVMVVRYLVLAVWPGPLVLDYGLPGPLTGAQAFPFALVLAGLVGATLYAMVRRPVVGFIGAWFFVVIAPSSSVIPVATEVGAIRRMYLPLAAIVVLLVVFVATKIPRRRQWLAPALLSVVAVALGAASMARNAEYRDDEVLWRKDIERLPQWRAYYNLGEALERKGLQAEAIQNLREAFRLAPEALQTVYRLALALDRGGQVDEAVRLYEQYLRQVDSDAPAHNLLGTALAKLGRGTEAIAQFQAALRVDPGLADAHANLGASLQEQKRYDEAVREYRAFLELNPGDANIQNSLGVTLAQQGRVADALEHFARAVQIEPQYAVAQLNLGRALMGVGRTDEAGVHLREALRLNPDFKAAVASAMAHR